MPMDLSLRDKSKGGPSDHKRSSSHNSDRSKAGPLKIKDQARLFRENENFVSVVKSLKAIHLSLNEEYNHKDNGLEALQTDIENTIKKLKESFQALATKLNTIQQKTAQKKHDLDSLESAKTESKSRVEMTSDIVLVWKTWLDDDNDKEERRAMRDRTMEEVRFHDGRRVVVRPRNVMRSDYKGDWFRLSSADRYFLEKYGTQGFKPNDVILGRDGLQEQLKKQFSDPLKKIEWHRYPKRDLDWENRIRIKDLSSQEIGRIG